MECFTTLIRMLILSCSHSLTKFHISIVHHLLMVRRQRMISYTLLNFVTFANRMAVKGRARPMRSWVMRSSPSWL